MNQPDCELCHTNGQTIIWQNALCRVIHVNDADYPAFYRVILNRHEKEMSDLTAPEQQQLMHIVFTVEAALQQVLQPHKINLASLGNVVPHVHWHIIARWADDKHYPNPIWGAPQRDGATHATAAQLEHVRLNIVQALA